MSEKRRKEISDSDKDFVIRAVEIISDFEAEGLVDHSFELDGYTVNYWLDGEQRTIVDIPSYSQIKKMESKKRK